MLCSCSRYCNAAILHIELVHFALIIIIIVLRQGTIDAATFNKNTWTTCNKDYLQFMQAWPINSQLLSVIKYSDLNVFRDFIFSSTFS